MIRRKCYEKLGKRCAVKTESKEVYERNEKYVKRSSTRKRESKKYLD